ncbi:MAG: type II secretion system protein N [Acidiferrobacterales bacterium]
MAYPLAHAGKHAFGAWTEGLTRVPGQRWWPTALNALAVMVLAASMAQWTWQLVQPPLPRIIAHTADISASANFDLQGLLAAQLFGQATPDSAPSATPVEQIPASDLNLVLVGLVAAGPESLALIRVDPEPETPFAIGDEISHGVTLRAVYPDRAIIQRRGRTEALLLEDVAASLGDTTLASTPAAPAQPGIRAQGGNSFAVDREFVRTELRNPDIFRQALIVPNAGGGFLVRQIQPGSVYAKLGLQVGDVIRKVNGRRINSANEALQLYQQLGGLEQVGAVQLEVMRAGRIEQLEYSIQ